MKILVDADACPVKDIIVKIAKEYGIPVWMFIDTSHVLDDGYSKVTVVEQGKDTVDIALINKTEKGDVVVTQDYGVAAMALAKKAYAINQNGLIYDDDNIDMLLFQRHISQKIRRSGGRTKNPVRRTQRNNIKFEDAFLHLIKIAIKGE